MKRNMSPLRRYQGLKVLRQIFASNAGALKGRYYVGKRYKCGGILLIFFKKLKKLFSGTCRYYVGKRCKCDEKWCKKTYPPYTDLDTFLIKFPPKSWSKIRCKNRCRKNIKIIAKGSQNGAEINAKTHQKSMPELVSKKIEEIIKKHVSLKSEIIEIH